MEPDVLLEANIILSNIIESSDPYEKVTIILKIIPIECFDEAFRFFSEKDQKIILECLDKPTKVFSIETAMVTQEFIRLNNLMRYLKTGTQHPEEILRAFQKYTSRNPRKISNMLYETWLKERKED